MKVYFSCSITGGRQDQPTYRFIVDELVAAGQQVLTAVLANAEIDTQVEPENARQVYQRDIAWLEECDLVVAEVSTPSHGVGYEIAYALCHAKPVICFFRQGAKVSKIITGNDLPGMQVISYTGKADLQQSLAEMRQNYAGM